MSRPLELGFMTHVPGALPPARAYAELSELFVAAEALGYESGWIAQHHLSGSGGQMPSPLVGLAAIAARTRRIGLGTAVTVLPLEDPLRLAEDAAVLDQLSHGRVRIGLGSGGANRAAFAAFGADWSMRTAEFLQRTARFRGILRGEAREQVGGATLHPPAPGLADRIWQARGSVEGAAAAGLQGDGLLLGTAVHDPSTVQRPLAEAYLSACGQSGAIPRIGVIRAVFPASDKAASIAELAPDLAPFGDWLRREGLVQGVPGPDEIVRRLNVHHGNPDEIVDSLSCDPALLAHASQLIVVVQSAGSRLQDALRRLETIAREIAPRLGRTGEDS